MVNRSGVPVKEVLLKGKPKIPFPDGKTLSLIGAGVAHYTAGLTLSKQAEFEEALVAGPVIGYGPLVIKHLGGRLMRSFKEEIQDRKKISFTGDRFSSSSKQVKVILNDA